MLHKIYTEQTYTLSGNTFRVGYQLSICHTLGTVLGVHQSSENMYRYFHIIKNNQRTNGPVNAHLISWPSKAQNIQNLEKYGKEMTLTFNTHIPS